MKSQESIWSKLYKERLGWKKETISLPNILKGKSVLELGAGTGKTLKSILKQSPRKIVAIDFSEEALTKAKELIKSDKVEFIKADLLEFQSDEKFDVIVCYYLLNNLDEEERKRAVEKMQELLKEKGIILFEDFAKGDFREKVDRKDGLFCHFFSEAEIKSLFAGFSDVKIETKTSTPIRTNKKLERRIISAIIKN